MHTMGTSEKGLEYLQQHFELRTAVGAGGKRAAFRVRHEVWCREYGHLPDGTDGEGVETDEYDEQSLHCVLWCRDVGRPIGCTRLILTRSEDRSDLLPIEKHCAEAFDRSIYRGASVPRREMAEASRLTLVREFRSSSAGPGDDTREWARRQLSVVLYLSYFAMSVRSAVEHMFVLTEERLAVHLRDMGFAPRQLGPPVEYLGLRVPSVILPNFVVANMRPELKPIYSFVEASIDRSAGRQGGIA